MLTNFKLFCQFSLSKWHARRCANKNCSLCIKASRGRPSIHHRTKSFLFNVFFLCPVRWLFLLTVWRILSLTLSSQTAALEMLAHSPHLPEGHVIPSTALKLDLKLRPHQELFNTDANLSQSSRGVNKMHTNMFWVSDKFHCLSEQIFTEFSSMYY